MSPAGANCRAHNGWRQILSTDDVAKPKRKLKHEEDVFWESDGQTINVEDTQFIRQAAMEERGESPVAYAPGPNPDAKWKAFLAVCTMPGWNGTMKGVMACLIECANYYSGKCCPSEEWMAKQLGCDPSSVKRAVARLKSKYLSVLHRNEPTDTKWKSNAYVVGWSALINRCHHVFPWTDRKHRGATLHEQGGNVAQNRGSEVTRKDIEKRNIEGRYEHKTVRPPSVADTRIDSFFERLLKERGLQERGAVESASTNSQRPAEPISEQEATKAVNDYLTPFDRDHLTARDIEMACAAELQTPGSGYAVVKAASQEAWRLKRKEKEQQ
jgi:Helix-turn-helix domain